MMKSLYEQQQLAASCSSTTHNSNVNNSHLQYPLAMDCDPPVLATQQMPPPPPPQQQSRFGMNTSSLQGGGVTSTTSGPGGSSSSSSSSGSGSANSRLRQSSAGGSIGVGSVFNKQHPQQSMAHSSTQQPPQSVQHHHNFAPASLPLDLHHPLSAAASHLMMTDSSVITASASAAGPAYSSWPSSGRPNNVFGIPTASTHVGVGIPTSNMVMGDMVPPPLPAHLQQQQQQQHLQMHQPQQLQHSQRRTESQTRLPPGGSTSSSSNSASVGPGGGSGSSASGDASSPMVGVCVQQSPVVIH